MNPFIRIGIALSIVVGLVWYIAPLCNSPVGVSLLFFAAFFLYGFSVFDTRTPVNTHNHNPPPESIVRPTRLPQPPPPRRAPRA